jgi:hypothetical protein
MSASIATTCYAEEIILTLTELIGRIFQRKSTRSTQNAPMSDGSMLFNNMVNQNKVEEVDMLTRAWDYNNHESTSKGKETLDPHNSLHSEKHEKAAIPCIQKGVYKRASHNPNSQSTPKYYIVEDLAQTPCAMLALEMLQLFPA